MYNIFCLKIWASKTLGVWKRVVPEKHFMSANMGVHENWMSKNVVS